MKAPAWSVVLLLTAATASSFADERTDARRIYEQAIKEYNLQQWESALHDFQKTYLAHPDPALLFNIAQCQRQLSEYTAASKSYRLYLSQSPDAENREQVRKLIDEMDAAAKQSAAKPAPEPGKPAEPTPPTTSNSPPPAVIVTAAPAEGRSRSELSQKRLRVVGITTAGVGVAVIAAGIAFAVLSKQAGDAAYHPSSAVYDYGADQRQETFRSLDIACFVVGGAAAVAGTTLWALGRRK